MPDIVGKTVVVTGASRGIGLEFARQLSLKGNKVIAGCRSPEKAKEKISKFDGDISITQLDVSDVDSINKWADDVRQLALHIDVLINNAGIYGERVNLDTVTADVMMDVFKTNTIGPLIIIQQLRNRGLIGGKTPTLIANVTSKVGSIDDNKSGGGYAYRSSKNALNIITKSLSIDLADENVVATLIHPGWVITDMVNNKGLITSETSVAGMLSVLEKDPEELQGAWFDYDNKRIPW